MNYVQAVSSSLETGVDGVEIVVEETLTSAVMLLHARIPTLVEWPLLLTWDEVNGWSLSVRTEKEAVVIGYLGGDVLPDPCLVQKFCEEAESGQHPGVIAPPSFRSPNENDDLEQRLAHFGGR